MKAKKICVLSETMTRVPTNLLYKKQVLYENTNVLRDLQLCISTTENVVH